MLEAIDTHLAHSILLLLFLIPIPIPCFFATPFISWSDFVHFEQHLHYGRVHMGPGHEQYKWAGFCLETILSLLHERGGIFFILLFLLLFQRRPLLAIVEHWTTLCSSIFAELLSPLSATLDC